MLKMNVVEKGDKSGNRRFWEEGVFAIAAQQAQAPAVRQALKGINTNAEILTREDERLLFIPFVAVTVDGANALKEVLQAFEEEGVALGYSIPVPVQEHQTDVIENDDGTQQITFCTDRGCPFRLLAERENGVVIIDNDNQSVLRFAGPEFRVVRFIYSPEEGLSATAWKYRLGIQDGQLVYRPAEKQGKPIVEFFDDPIDFGEMARRLRASVNQLWALACRVSPELGRKEDRQPRRSSVHSLKSFGNDAPLGATIGELAKS